MKIYLAGAISGSGFDEVYDKFVHDAQVAMKLGYTVLWPMLAKEHFKDIGRFTSLGDTHPVSTNHAIFERDCWMVSQADVVLVDLFDAVRPSLGCSMELAIASHLHKHTIGIMEPGNCHEHAFILEALDIRFNERPSAWKYLRQLAEWVNG